MFSLIVLEVLISSLELMNNDIHDYSISILDLYLYII